MIKNFASRAIAGFVVLEMIFAAVAQAQSVVASGSSARLVTIIGKFGVDFASTSDSDARLRAAGADAALVQAVHTAKRAVAAADIP